MTDETALSSIITKLRNMPLKVRLSIPFFFLAALGTTALVVLAIFSQNDLIAREERERLFGYHRAMDHTLELQGQWAVSLASSFARNPEVAEALADKDRLRLIQLCYPAYTFMKKQYRISQFNFHVLPPRNFVRMQRLYEFGDSLEYRQTILDAVSQEKETFGIEEGITGYGIRGVAPIYFQGNMVGTVEIGFSFGLFLLEQMKKQFAIEASLLFPDKTNTFVSNATTFAHPFQRTGPVYSEVFRTGTPQFFIREIAGIPNAVLVRTVEDYKGRTVALMEFCAPRTDTLTLTSHYREIMLVLGIISMVLSVGAIYVISAFFTKPIGKMVSLARGIAQGEKEHHLTVRPSGELGILAQALDEMLMSLKESREKIQDYADNLEHMVLLRTRALRESEEKYRTLVESVPLVVYRLLGNGKTIFANHFIEDLMGVPVREVLEDADFWKEKVWEEDRHRVWPLMDRCLTEGSEFKAEYRVRHAGGNLLFVLDHALPVLDEKGAVETVDGILVNVTDRYRLQQQIIQTEELRTLTEISARLAHEIRNPLVAAGGFARRLLQSLPEEDPHRKKVEIIVHEVVRLEKILEKTLAYLKPFEVVLESASLNELLVQVFEEHRGEFNRNSVACDMNLSNNLPPTSLDQDLFKKALESLLVALLGYCNANSCLRFSTYGAENTVNLEMVVRGAHVSADDIEHFFYPFTSRGDLSTSLDLPLAKMIIHKHRGVIHLRLKDPDQLILNVSLPQ